MRLQEKEVFMFQSNFNVGEQIKKKKWKVWRNQEWWK